MTTTQFKKSISIGYVLFLTLSILLLNACKKDNNSNEGDYHFENNLISGNDCHNFFRTIGGKHFDRLISVGKTDEGGYIFNGYRGPFDDDDYDVTLFVLKTNCFGETEWITDYSTGYLDFGDDILQPTLNGYWILDNSPPIPNLPPETFPISLKKLNLVGEVVMSLTHDYNPSRNYNQLLEFQNGNKMICGSINSTGTFIMNTDQNLNEIWKRDFGFDTIINSIAINKNQNVFACGSLKVNNGNDILLLEFNQQGNIIWTKVLNIETYSSHANSISLFNNGDILLVGNYNPGNFYNERIFVLRLDQLGNEIWNNYLEHEIVLQKNINSISEDNQIKVLGFNGTKLVLVTLSSDNGLFLSENILTLEHTNDMKLTSDGGIILAGIYDTDSSNDGYIFKTNF